jgi:hypothetical protein
MNKIFLTGQQALQASVSNGASFPDQTNNGQQLFTNFKTKIMNKNVCFLAMILFANFFFLTGCQSNNDDIQFTPIEKVDPQVLRLSSDPVIQKELIFMKEKMGYNLSKISVGQGTGELSNYYMLQEGWDALLIPRTEIQESMKRHENESTIQASARHRVHGSMASAGAKNIRILAGVSSEWKTAVGSARTVWNDLGKSLTFNSPVSATTTAAKTVNVTYQSLVTLQGISLTNSKKIVATTSLPDSSSGIGLNLVINSDYPGTLTASQKKLIIAHELAHAIGFRHTDSYDGLALTTSNYACSNSLDGSSVWKSGTDPVPSWSSFSTCDQDAFDWYY